MPFSDLDALADPPPMLRTIQRLAAEALRELIVPVQTAVGCLVSSATKIAPQRHLLPLARYRHHETSRHNHRLSNRRVDSQLLGRRSPRSDLVAAGARRMRLGRMQ